MNKLIQFAIALLMMLPLAGAQQGSVGQESGNNQAYTGTIPAARNLRIKMESGTVRVEGGSSQGISYELHNRAYGGSDDRARGIDSYRVNAYTKGDTAWIVGDWGERRPRHSAIEITVHVPRNLDSLKVETEGGAVSANGVSGSVEAQTGGGAIRFQDIGGSVRAETGGDNIEVNGIGGDANLETGGGRVSIGSVKGRITASTGGGDIVLTSSEQGAVLEAGGGNIQVKQCGGKLRISTGGGNIDVGDASGPVEIETGGGSIRLSSAKGLVRAETGAGRIELNGIRAAHAQTGAGTIIAKFVADSSPRDDSTLQTAMGDVTVYLVSNLNIDVHASIDLANGHTIRSDFPEIRVMTEGGHWGPQTISAEGKLNGGGPLLRLSTTTGDISIRRVSQ